MPLYDPSISIGFLYTQYIPIGSVYPNRILVYSNGILVFSIVHTHPKFIFYYSFDLAIAIGGGKEWFLEPWYILWESK